MDMYVIQLLFGLGAVAVAGVLLWLLPSGEESPRARRRRLAGRRAAHRPADVAAPTHCSAKRWHTIVGRATCLSPLVDGVCPVAHRHSDVKAA